MTDSTRPTVRRLVCGLAAIAVAVTLLGACSDDDDGTTANVDTGDAQPGREGPSFTDSALGELPRFPRSREVSGVAETGDVTVQSFNVSNATPEEVVRWYEANLPAGWQAVEEPRALGATDWRGTWRNGDQELQVSAAPDPTATDEASDDVVTQYNLKLGPAGAEGG